MFVDNWSNPKTPPQVELLRADGGKLATLVEQRDRRRDHPYAKYRAEHRADRIRRTPAADGQTLHYSLIKPAGLRSEEELSGRRLCLWRPGVADRDQAAWALGDFNQYLAQQGYVVFSLDNRGTPRRGASFGSALFRQQGTVEVEDQVRGVDWLKTQPWVDGSASASTAGATAAT